jgi:TRAP-type C4-dicarboxylate transport system substrate-binding protein
MRNKKGIAARTGALLLILVFVFVAALSGCGDSDNDSGDAKTDDGTKVYNLKMNVHLPIAIAPGAATQWGCDKAEELSNGRLKFEVYYDGNYVAYDDTMTALADGTIDMALLDAAILSSGGLTLNQVFNKTIQTDLPDRLSISNAYRDLYKEVPELGEEFDSIGVHLASIMSVDGHNLHTTKKDVKVPADVKGMKLDTPGDSVAYFNGLNAAATSLDPGESLDAIKKNLIEGQVTHWALMKDFFTIDVLTHHTIFGIDKVTKESPEFESAGGLFAYFEGYGINLNTWNSLPEDLQAIIVEAFDGAGDEMARINFVDVVDSKTAAIDRGDVFTYVVGEDLQKWWDEGTKEMESWYKDCEKKGYDGKAVYEKMIAQIDKHNKAKQ